MRTRRWAAAALCAAAAWMGTAAPTAAQVEDSLSLRVHESLQRLQRAPGADTLRVPGDSLTRRPAPTAGRGARPRASGDSVAAALESLSGYAATRYRGLGAHFDAGTRVLVLEGDSATRAGIVREGTELTADSVIRFDEARGELRAEGHPLFTPEEGDPVESRVILYDVESGRGSALGARTRYSEGATWIVTGDLPSLSPDVVYGSHADFTSCDLEVPHYHFSAREVKIVAGRVLVARPVVLYFADVPVAWLPFMAQSLGSGRSSGILTPRFSVNDIVRNSTGYQRRISNLGFYWAINDYADATLAFDWFSDNFTSLTGSFRYAWQRQFLNGGLNLRQYWRAEGGRELAFDTNHDWQMDERTRFRLSARYSSSSEFVRRNSFDPLEVTQSINSTGGFDRRYDWGNVSLSGNRDQYLSDDRVVMTFPEVQLNLSTITLFPAPASRERWFNNLTWSGRANGSRRTVDYSPDPGEPLTLATSDLQNLRGGVSSSFSLGNLSWRQSLDLERKSTFDLPLVTEPAPAVGLSPSGRLLLPVGAQDPAEAVADVAQTDLTWNSSLGYQQTLIGSTTITPSLTFSGRSRRSDTVSVASDHFVSAPTRVSFGASFRSDLFGFFPGFGAYEAIRHKVSPGIDFSYQPEVTSTSLQERVFGRQAIRPRKEITLSLNQTFEAKRETADAVAATAPGRAAVGGPAGGPDGVGGLSTTGPTRAPRADIVTLLALRTTAVQYDFVEADSLGSFLWGFQTTRISNQISSDLLRGLSISVSHDLFADSTVQLGGGGQRQERRFDLHLSELNLGFSLDSRSALFRGFGLFGAEDGPEAPIPPEDEEPLADERPATDESTIIPGDPRGPTEREARRPQGVGNWSANFSYSLARPRNTAIEASQMLTASFNLRPTPLWDLSWRTSYDLERGQFNDHMIRLSRDIHDWEAHFDFSQTAIGNWAFRFEVALKANRDFKFDYKQQNLQTLPR